MSASVRYEWWQACAQPCMSKTHTRTDLEPMCVGKAWGAISDDET